MSGISQSAVKRYNFGRRDTPPASAAHFAPTPTAPDSNTAPAPFDRGRVIADSFSLMAKNSVTFLALVAAAAAPERIAYHVFMPQSAAGLLALSFLTALTCAPLYAAIFTGARLTLEGAPVTFQICLRAGLRMPRPAALLSLMTAMMVWLLLIVPGIAVATGWAVAAPVALAEGLGTRAAMARSRALTAPHRAQVRVLVLLLAGLAIARALPMLAIWGIPVEGVLVFMFGNWLFPLLLTAFTAAAGASLYWELTQGRQQKSLS